MFRKRLFAASNIVGFLTGAAFIVATIYIPIFIQGVMGGSATNSGLLLLPMMLGTTVAAQMGGFLSSKMSYRNIMLIFGVIFIGGIFLLTTLTPESTRTTVTLYMIVTGLGIGASFSVLGMSAIHSFDATQRGSASSTMAFLRSLGMAIGITVYGIIQRNGMTSKINDTFASMGCAPQGMTSDDPRAILSEQARASIPGPVLDKITSALSSSIVQTFVWALIPAVLALLFTFMMGKERMALPGKSGKPDHAAAIKTGKPEITLNEK
ncbi:multidrug resistance protein [Paenibacillus larvae subsp. larvae DSM 25430]|uniref:Multidrug resistance protein n=1 Tax=Paenibacillus larvae subsp. larvae DSM 25430 TaxID=697284 RepID=V9W2R0_9BACL|nr:multidrug resistance protein [Paenibacillus larvae subsp. larvae DSM 25430]AVG11032.1 multidrug resistance protein [Paenibacillus larvae subsp. larvae DSM 25430]